MASTSNMTSLSNQQVMDCYRRSGPSAAVGLIIESEFGKRDGKMTNVESLRSQLRRINDKIFSPGMKLNSKEVEKKEAFASWLDSHYELPASIKPGTTVFEPPKAKKRLVLENLPPYNNKIATRSVSTNGQDQDRLDEIEKALDHSRDENAALKARMDFKDKELKRRLRREAYHRERADNLESRDMPVDDELQSLQDLVAEKEYQIAELQEKVKAYSEEIKKLSDELQSREQTEKCIQTFDNSTNTYITGFRSLVYQLLSNHVPQCRISSVISEVLNFAGKEASNLPCLKTIANMNLERLGLAQLQISEQLEGQKNMTLYDDETSKFGQKFMGYHVKTEDRYYVMGLRDMATKGAQDTLNTFLEILADIDSLASQSEANRNDVGKKILANIQNTMSDRAATELKFHELLQLHRSSILPEFHANYEHLNEAERKSVERLNNFFCGLHSFVQIAEAADGSLRTTEEGPETLGPQIIQKDESGTVRLLRTASKLFSRGADEKSGCFRGFLNFLKDEYPGVEISSLKLVQFRGNRFCIIFFEGANVDFYADDMQKYLEGKENKNKLDKAVLEDLQCTSYRAGLKALGLVGKYFALPMWRIMECKDTHIMDLGQHIDDMIRELEVEIENGFERILDGSFRVEGFAVKENDVLVRLLTARPYDDKVIGHLSVMVPAIIKLLHKQYQPFLTGEYSAPEDSIRLVTRSVECHNKFSERVFAYTDHLLRVKPHISHLAQEAYVMFVLNKTGEWLAGKNEAETKELVGLARRKVGKLREMYAERQREITRKRIDLMNERRRAEEARKIKKSNEKELIVQDIMYFSLYQSNEDVEEKLNEIRGKGEREDALKAQLRFRKEILGQEDQGENLYKFSVAAEDGGRRNLTEVDLRTSVERLIQIARERNVGGDMGRNLKGRGFKQVMVDGGERNIFEGK